MAEQPITQEQRRKHLKETAEIVRGWPAWMREGAHTPMTQPKQLITQAQVAALKAHIYQDWCHCGDAFCQPTKCDRPESDPYRCKFRENLRPRQR